MSAAATMPMPREASNYDEISMQQSMLFSDSLKVDSKVSSWIILMDFVIIAKALNLLFTCSANSLVNIFVIQDLKNLRTQLYSAAEYFELSYTNDEQKQMWVSLFLSLIVIVLFSWSFVSFYLCM